MSFFRKYLLEYQFFALFIFLMLISITTSMKVTLPIYIVLSMLPYFTCLPKKIEIIPFFIIFISCVYVLYGLISQDRMETMVSFFSKTYQFIVFILFFAITKKIKLSANSNGIKLMYSCILVESFLGIYFLIHGQIVDRTSGLTRITAGRQPVGGNFSIAMAPVIFYSYFHHHEKMRKIVLLSTIPAVWVLLSGTRGYILLYFLSLSPMYWDYFFSIKQKTRKKMIFVLVFIFLCIFLLFYFIFLDPTFLEQISIMLRLNAGTGIRSIENRIAFDFFCKTNIFYKVFGIGYGGVPAEVPGYIEAVSDNATSHYVYDNYVNRIGVSYHNLFSNYLLLQGLIGCIQIILIFFWGIRKLKWIHAFIHTEKICMYLYWIGFFIMNCFRWSCDCGISEMIIFAIILGLIENSYSNSPRLI